jgi:hypothetical protein
MHTGKLWDLADKYVPHFKGVYPLDKIPPSRTMKAPSNFIINTHTANLGGEHWLAVSYLKGGFVFAFDSFGVYYPRILRAYLESLRRSRKVHYNTIQYQEIHEQTCGLYCVAWLICINTKHGSH